MSQDVGMQDIVGTQDVGTQDVGLWYTIDTCSIKILILIYIYYISFGTISLYSTIHTVSTYYSPN